MKELKCPHCGKAFTVNEEDYASIANQVRTSEFELELERRVVALHEKLDAEKKLEATAKLAEIAQLKAQVDGAEQNRKLSVAEAVAAKDREIAEIKAKAQTQSAEAKIAALEREQRVREDLMRKQAEIDDLKVKANLALKEAELQQRALKDQYDTELKAKDEQVAFYKDFKARKSTKEIGESLEQYCYKLYSQYLRPVMPNAEFDKDNDASEGSKGDFIFRDKEDGLEYISIMFEMKNEADETASKHKNADFFAKLDKDRQQKNCEFAVLVSMLEMDNDMYNEGIVVAPGYDKMYVIRPENFIPLISLLVQTSKKSLEYKKELEIAKNQSYDVADFEKRLQDFQLGFSKHYTTAEKYFDTVLADIDKTIASLEKMRRDLTTTGNQLRLANNKASELSIKKLTYGNKTMKAKFDEARAAAALEDGAAEEQ